MGQLRLGSLGNLRGKQRAVGYGYWGKSAEPQEAADRDLEGDVRSGKLASRGSWPASDRLVGGGRGLSSLLTS